MTKQVNYNKVNPSMLYKTNARYRILSSSLSTLMALRDTSENLELQLSLQISINKIQKELSGLTRLSR